MLSYEELANIARLKRLSLANAEKDYLQDIILMSIYSHVGNELVFKGGTCLYKIYGLNRFSEDLDFTFSRKIQIEKLMNYIVHDAELLNIHCKIKRIEEYRNEINAGILFNGPLYKGTKQTQCFIPLNISSRERICGEVKKVNLISTYREIPNFDVFVMDEEEILAEKIRAILTRDKARDVYDLWFLLVKKKVPLNMEFVNRKLKYYSLSFDKEKLIEGIKIKRKLWELDLKNLIIGELPSFDDTFQQVLEIINKHNKI